MSAVLPSACSSRYAISGETALRPAMRLWSCCRVTPKPFAASTIVRPISAIMSPTISPGWGGFFIGMASPPSMIIDEVNIKGFAVLEPKDYAPVRAHGERPKALEVALQRVQPEGRQIEVADTQRRVEQGQNLADFPRMFSVDASGIVIFEKL